MKIEIKELKSKALPLWIQLLGKLGINGAKSALEKRLKDGSPEEELVLAIADPLVGTINDLSDTEPENTQQVRSRWRKWLEVFMIPWLFRLIQPIVTKIKAEYNRKMVQYLKDSSEKIALLLTDDIKPDNQQIDNFIDTEVAKPETKDLVINQFAGGNLLKAGLDEDLVAFLIEAANIGWDAIIGKAQAQGVSVEVIAKGKIITLPSGRRATFYNQAA